jgi:hypothetical protein
MWSPLPPETQTLLRVQRSNHEQLALGRMMRSFVDAILRGAPDNVWDTTFFDGYRAQVWRLSRILPSGLVK